MNISIIFSIIGGLIGYFYMNKNLDEKNKWLLKLEKDSEL